MTKVYIVYETLNFCSESTDYEEHQYTGVDKVFDTESKAVEYIRIIINQQIDYYTNRIMDQRREYYQYEADCWIERLKNSARGIYEDRIIDVGRRITGETSYYYKSYDVE